MEIIERLEAELKLIVRTYLDYLGDHDDDEATRSRMHDLMMLTAYLPNIDGDLLTSDENIEKALDIDY